MFVLDQHTLPFILLTVLTTGTALAFSFISSAIEERVTVLETRINELVDETYQQSEKIEALNNELEEKTTKLTDVRAKLASILKSVDEDYSDMPELVKA